MIWKNAKYLLLLTWVAACCLSCRKAPNPTYTYLFLGHPYQWNTDGNRLDYRVEALNLDQYDGIWLGGDVCADLTKDSATLRYLDSLLHFDNGRVHWAWGNHDLKHGRQAYLEAITGRPGFYTDTFHRMGVTVLNTNLLHWPGSAVEDSVCVALQQQWEMLERLAAAPPDISHLVVLHHYGLLTDALTGGHYAMDTIFNYNQPQLEWLCEDTSATFQQKIYPLFQGLQEQGIQVIFVGGDMGMRAKKFSWQTDAGIWFLGAGINNTVPDWHRPAYLTNFDPDQYLIFRHWPAEQRLEWSFEQLE